MSFGASGIFTQSVVRVQHLQQEENLLVEVVKDDIPLEYGKAMVASAIVFSKRIQQQRPVDVLMIGLGGASFSNFLNYKFPNVYIDIVEIDPAVVQASKKYMFFSRVKQMQSYYSGCGVIRCQNPEKI